MKLISKEVKSGGGLICLVTHSFVNNISEDNGRFSGAIAANSLQKGIKDLRLLPFLVMAFSTLVSLVTEKR